MRLRSGELRLENEKHSMKQNLISDFIYLSDSLDSIRDGSLEDENEARLFSESRSPVFESMRGDREASTSIQCRSLIKKQERK